MFLHSGTIVRLNADGSDGAQITARPQQKTLTVGRSLRADVVLQEAATPPQQQQLEDAAASAAIYFEIVGDAFGKVCVCLTHFYALVYTRINPPQFARRSRSTTSAALRCW